MTDPLEDVYAKYLSEPIFQSDPEREVFAEASRAPCPRCESQDVDRSNGYRGEYKCRACGHTWQVGGKDAKR